MRPVIFAAAAACLITHAAPVLADKYFAVTPSGAAEMLFPDKPSIVIGELSSKCIDARWSVTSTTTNEVVCEVPLNAGQSILGQMLLGNSYSTPPHRFVRSNIAEVNGISRVQAGGWVELQMAFGQIRRTELSGPQFQNDIMNFMAAAGGKYPLGTTFPNHAALGVDVEGVQEGKYAAMRIKKIEPGSAAEKAGIQVGDIITRIAGKQFRTLDDYFDATGKAAETATYPVELTRNGKAMTLTVERAFRPPFSEKVVPKVEVPPAPAPAQVSVADELEKLEKLKQQGVITDAEFEIQKKKLLGEQ